MKACSGTLWVYKILFITEFQQELAYSISYKMFLGILFHKSQVFPIRAIYRLTRDEQYMYVLLRDRSYLRQFVPETVHSGTVPPILNS